MMTTLVIYKERVRLIEKIKHNDILNILLRFKFYLF